jgi:hypothetical protein
VSDVDRRVVRRALRAGAAAGAALAVAALAANAAFGGDGAAALVWALSALVVGLLVAAGWLVLAALLDLVAGVLPGRRRLAWTAGLFAAAFVAPVLPSAALRAAGAG